MQGRAFCRRILILSCAAAILSAAMPSVAAGSPAVRGFRQRAASAWALTVSAPSEPVVRELPAGTRVGGVLAGDSEHDWLAVVHRGQVIDLTLHTPAAYDGLALLGVFDTLMPDGPTADPMLAEPVIASGGETGHLSFTAPYDTIIAISVCALDAGYGSYVLDYSIADRSYGAQDPETAAPGIERVAGATRFETAIRGSEAAFADGSCDTAIVATGLGFADALAASGLAGSYDCPILLTARTKLSDGVDSEITRLGAKRLFVLGGAGTISDEVLAQLAHDGRTVQRLAGKDRYATAAAIAEAIRGHEMSVGREPNVEPFVVSGKTFPDALTVAPLAFGRRAPVLLAPPTGTPVAASSEIASIGATDVYVVGGPASVPDDVAEALGATAHRVAGADRVSTSIAIAGLAVSNGWASWKHVGVTTGWNFPDGFAAAPLVAKQGGVLLLSNPTHMPKPLYDAFYAHRFYSGDPVFHVTAFGSPASLFGAVLGHAEHAYWWGEPWVEPMGVRYGGD